MNCDVGEVTVRLENEQSLHLRHSSFSNPSVASPTWQLIIQPFRCFTYIAAPILLSFLLRHKFFTYVTWRAAHGKSKIMRPSNRIRQYKHYRNDKNFVLLKRSVLRNILRRNNSYIHTKNCYYIEMTEARMEDAGTSEEDHDIDSQDPNTPIDHGHLARNCSIKILLHCLVIAQKILVVSTIKCRPRVRKSRYWGKTLQVPHPLLWRNEASLLVQWRTMYFPFAL